jgi:hypothetical protein
MSDERTPTPDPQRADEPIAFAEQAKAAKDLASTELRAALEAYVRGEASAGQLMKAYQIRGHANLAYLMGVLNLLLVPGMPKEKVVLFVTQTLGEEWPDIIDGGNDAERS